MEKNIMEKNELINMLQSVNIWIKKLQKVETQDKLEIKVEDNFLIVEHTSTNLRFANSSKDIIEIFAKQSDKSFSKDELIYLLYGDISNKSLSYKRTVSHNTIKRISRCRQFLNDSLKKTFPSIQWLYHDKELGSWRLYNIRQSAVHSFKIV